MFSKVLSVIIAIPQIISAIRDLISWWSARNREQAAEKAKEAVDETTRTGDQRTEEEILNPGGGGKPTVHVEPGLEYRPVKDRSKE